jgi:isopentenyldiphosphate isomerase
VAESDASGELVDLVDEHGTVIGRGTRAEVRADHHWHRSVFIAVLSTDGAAVLTHQRADWKDVWPSRFDIAFGGVLAVGESFAEGAVRELAEEAGLMGVAFQRWGAGRFDDGEVREHAEVFAARSDGPFTFADGEVVATEWVPLDRLDAWVEGHDVCPDSLALVGRRLARRS